jgi:hypothetical protein
MVAQFLPLARYGDNTVEMMQKADIIDIFVEWLIIMNYVGRREMR